MHGWPACHVTSACARRARVMQSRRPGLPDWADGGYRPDWLRALAGGMMVVIMVMIMMMTNEGDDGDDDQDDDDKL